VPFLFLARAFEDCGETTKRLEIGAILANAFRTIIATTPDDLLPAVYLASCAVAPQYEGVDLGIGDATLVKALAEATGRSEGAVKEAYTQQGDLGIVAQQSRATQRTMFAMPILTIRGVFATLKDIAKTEGAKSSERKRGAIKKLLVSAREVEAGYIIRLLQGKLRIGLAQQTVVTALAHAALLAEQAAAAAAPGASATSVLSATSLADRLSEADAILKQVYSECPTWDRIVPAMLSNGVMALPDTCHFVPGIPIKPMLAKATRGARPCFRYTQHAHASPVPRVLPALSARAPGCCCVRVLSPNVVASSQAWLRLWSAFRTSSSRANTSTTASARRCTCWRTAMCACFRATWRTTPPSTPTSCTPSRRTSSRACAPWCWTRRLLRTTARRTKSCPSKSSPRAPKRAWPQRMSKSRRAPHAPHAHTQHACACASSKPQRVHLTRALAWSATHLFCAPSAGVPVRIRLPLCGRTHAAARAAVRAPPAAVRLPERDGGAPAVCQGAHEVRAACVTCLHSTRSQRLNVRISAAAQPRPG
jgi:hypothetical protein